MKASSASSSTRVTSTADTPDFGYLLGLLHGPHDVADENRVGRAAEPDAAVASAYCRGQPGARQDVHDLEDVLHGYVEDGGQIDDLDERALGTRARDQDPYGITG